ncbi:MAG: hypothetical protein PHN22_00680 [Candidatus ainarchaeum sp.]|nr:hypothetical protein [Candidatus ainarchaeum sp.]
MIKFKKINVIRPTLRHKKRYLKISCFNDLSSYDNKKLAYIFIKNFQKTHGLFKTSSANISVLDFKNNIIIIRVNKLFLNDFLSSLFYINNDLGLLFIEKQSFTLKSLIS